MKKIILLASCALAAVILPSATGANANGNGKVVRRVLSFTSMYAVDGPFLGETNAIQGVDGDELPWVVESARGRLTSDGKLQIDVQGLVFSDDPKVPPELQGINDEAEFRGLVSCLTEDDQGKVVQVHVLTEGFPATVSGDCQINGHVDLPDPCIAPTVFVLAGSEDKWFAVTGVEVEKD
jgi:hypothetical protein